MTRESFVKACKFAMETRQFSIYGRKKNDNNNILRERCSECLGKCWPKELQITTVEDIMSNFFVCDLCGRASSTKVRKSLGMSLCNSCANVAAGLGHMKELAAALKKTGKTDELLKALNVEEKRYEDLEVVAIDAIEILAKALAPVPTNIDDTMSAYEVATIAEEAAQHIASLEKQNAGKRAEVAWLQEQLDDMKRNTVDEALLRWARQQQELGRVRVEIAIIEKEVTE